jgi:hypothetical protein
MAQDLSKNKYKTPGIRIKPNEGLWITYQLRLRGITQKQLAAQLGVRASTVGQIISGWRSSRRIEKAIYQALGCTSFDAMIVAATGNRKDGQ